MSLYSKIKNCIEFIFLFSGIFFYIQNYAVAQDYPPINGNIKECLTDDNNVQRGTLLLLELQTDTLINEKLTSLGDLAHSVLRENNIKHSPPKVESKKLHIKILDKREMLKATSLIVKQENEKMSVETENNDLIISYTDDALDRIKAEALFKSTEIVRRRINELGIEKATVKSEDDNKISITLPGVKDGNTLVEIETLLGTAKMSFHLVDETISLADAQRGKLPLDAILLTGDTTGTLIVKRIPFTTGDQFDMVKPTYSERGEVIVTFSLRPNGAKSFANTTKENIGKRIAIVLDDKIISAPVIANPITTGQGVIFGNFTIESASFLALMLRSGPLPAPLVLIEMRTVDGKF